MTWWHALLRRQQRDRELDAELRYHFDRLIDDHVRSGLDPREARRRATLQFGGVDHLKETCRDERGFRCLSSLAHDVRFAARFMRRDPGFTLTAVAVLGLGIGVNNMFFTILHAHTMRGMPIPGAERVVTLSVAEKAGRERGVSRIEYEALEAGARTASRVAAFVSHPVIVEEAGYAPERVSAGFVSASLFDLVSVRPAFGRSFGAGDDQPGANGLAILTESIWRSRYGADPGVMHRSIEVDGKPVHVIGVAPDRSGIPTVADIWLPLSQLAPAQNADAPHPPSLQVLARLRDDVMIADAAAEFDAIVARANAGTAAQDSLRVRAVPVNERYFGRATDPVWLAFLAAGTLVVLISCANVAILLLGRCAARGREMAIRASLGASRARMTRQLLVEGTALATLGGLLGLGVSIASIRVFSSAIPAGVLPYWIEYTVDGRIVLVLAAVSLATVLAFALAPALQLSGVDVNRVLKAGGPAGGERRSSRLISAVLTAELAVTVVLLSHLTLAIGASAPPPAEEAIAEAGLVTAAITLPAERYPTPESRDALYRRLRERMDTAATHVSVATRLPLTGAEDARVWTGERPDPAEDAPAVPVVGVGPGYFSALGLTMRQGREFTDADGLHAAAYAVVNERFVAQFLEGRAGPGERIGIQRTATGDEPVIVTIVGVAPDIRQRPSAQPEAVVYLPYRAEAAPTAWLVARGPGDPGALVSLLRRELQVVDRSLPLYRTQSMVQVMRDAEWNGRVSRRLILFLNLVAVVLATGGLFTVAAWHVAQRIPEIGLRMALGARSRHIVRTILRRTALQLGAGFAAGIGLAKVWGSVFGGGAPQLNHPGTVLIIAGILTLAGIAASAVPAWRATRLDPVAALRRN